MLRADKTLVLVKAETTYGTDSSPVKTTDAILATNVKVDPVFKKLERMAMSPAGGSYAPLVIGEGAKITFETELFAAASANAVPSVGALLEACSFKKTGGTSTPCVYTLGLDNFEIYKSVTIHVYFDQILHQITGCVGNVKIDMVTTELVKLSFDFTGLYSTPVAGSVPQDTTFNTASPLVFKQAVMTFDSISFTGTTIGFDAGNTIEKRTDWSKASGISNYYVSKNAPKITLDPEAVAPDSLEFWSYIETQNPGALSITLEAGSRDVVITSENVVMDDQSDGERGNILTKNVTLVPKAVLNDSTYAPIVITFN